MAPPMPPDTTPPRSDADGRARVDGRSPVAAVVIALVTGVGALVLHQRFIALDHALPIADASGHLLNTTRWLAWLNGSTAPREAFPPGVYLLAGTLMRWKGESWDMALTAVALHGALLVAGASWFATRAAGPFAGLTAALLTLSAPYLTGASRMLLLDIPATAAIVWIWALCWESRGFSRWWPTLALGPVLAWGALCKYTLILWIIPSLLLHGLRLAGRRPTAILPLLGVTGTCAIAIENLVQHAKGTGIVHVALASIGAIEELHLGVIGALLLLIAAATVVGERARGVRDGAVLGLAATACLAAISPWFFDSGPAVWTKIKHEAVDEIRAAGSVEGQRFVLGLVASNWPVGRFLMLGGAVLEGAGIATSLLARGRWPRVFGTPPEQWFPGPAVEVALSCVVGCIATAHVLPVDPRYYLPAIAGAALVVGIGVCRISLFAYTFGAVVAAAAAGQTVRGTGLPVGLLAVDRIDPLTFDPGAFARSSPIRFFLPPTPGASTIADPLDALLLAVANERPSRCDEVVLHVPAFGVGRAAGFEPQSIASLGTLHGIKHCAWHWTSLPPTDAERESAKFVAVFGLTPASADQFRAVWSETLATSPVLSADTNGFAVRLYKRP